jgi:hypothetical protein
MGATYEVWIGEPNGRRIWPCFNLLNLSASKILMGIGQIGLYVPLNFPINLLRRDMTIQVWRAPHGYSAALWNTYFLRGWKIETKPTGRKTIYLSGPDINYALTGRVVAHYAGEPESQQTNEADDMMKVVMNNAKQVATNPATTYSPMNRSIGNITTTHTTHLGPIISKAFAWEQVLSLRGVGGVLREIHEAALEQDGTEVYFGLVPRNINANEITYEFTTWIGQIADVTKTIIFSADRGNLATSMQLEDYSNEVTYVYGAGQGQKDARNIQQVYDPDRIAASMWNRREIVADARTSETSAAVLAVARSKLAEGKPIQKFTGTLMDAPGYRFGVDWDFGYRVKAEVDWQSYTPIVAAATILLTQGREHIKVGLEYITDV